MISQELLEQVVAEVGKHVRKSKGYETKSWISLPTPVDSVGPFAMAMTLTEQQLFEHCVSVAPKSHVYRYFFEQRFGASILSVHVDYPPRRCKALNDFDPVRGVAVPSPRKTDRGASSLRGLLFKSLSKGPN